MIVVRANSPPHALLDSLNTLPQYVVGAHQHRLLDLVDAAADIGKPVNDEDLASVSWKINAVILVYKDDETDMPGFELFNSFFEVVGFEDLRSHVLPELCPPT